MFFSLKFSSFSFLYYISSLPPMLIIIHVFLAIVCLFFSARFLLYRTALIHAVRMLAIWIDDRIHVHLHFSVPEFNEYGQHNIFYRKVQLYVNSMASLEDSDFTNLFSGQKSNEIILHLDDDQLIRDSFLGATICWINRVLKPHQNENIRTRSFLLKLKRKDKRRILQPYLQHIHTVVDDIERRIKEIKLFININLPLSDCSYGRWRSTPFSHPSTFDTIVMEPDLLAKIKSDLDTFLKSESYYQKLGRVWKRSYLLYGPSGTGKSSFIAAMTNYLSFDIYYIDLNQISDDSDLKMLLLQTTSKSITVIEDIDRFVKEKSTAVNFSLSGVLNFMDGIVNPCCGDERIFVFTMNNKDGVDSAILRPGRIDVHINFPLCDFNSFKSLANNYLGVKEHKLFPQVQEMLNSGTTMSPAEIGELMLVHRTSPSRALKSVITALQSISLKTTPRISYNESTSSLPMPPQSTDEYGSPAWKEIASGKELRRLYGLLKLKSSKKTEPLNRDSGFTER